MAKVINFADRLVEKQAQEESDSLKDFFTTKLLPFLTDEDKLGIMNAIEAKDFEAYRKITEPILMRNVMRSFN